MEGGGGGGDEGCGMVLRVLGWGRCIFFFLRCGPAEARRGTGRVVGYFEGQGKRGCVGEGRGRGGGEIAPPQFLFKCWCTPQID